MQTFMNNESNACRRYLAEMRLAGEEARAHYEHLAEGHVRSADQRIREILERAQRAQEAADQQVRQSRHGEEAEARAARERSLRQEEQCSEFATANARMRNECDFAQQQCELLARHVQFLEEAQARQHAEHQADRQRLELDLATVQDSMQQLMTRAQPAEAGRADSEMGEQVDDEWDGHVEPNLFEQNNVHKQLGVGSCRPP